MAKELLNADEKADILNTITKALNDKGIKLDIGMWEDDGDFFHIYLMEKLGA